MLSHLAAIELNVFLCLSNQHIFLCLSNQHKTRVA
uniref:Uncharacterized protein n=1 Tax=Lepeophtheirus salmonis TaxID=72036 RepID=A0A0K2VGZ0_LEPSM